MTPEAQNLHDLLTRGRVEIRAQNGDQWWSGVFDDYASLARSARYAEKRGFNTYVGLNPCACPVTGNIKPYRKAVSDDDVERICRVPFDFDPERETGTAATDIQLGYAKDRVRVLTDLLESFGWQAPIIGFSGNGYHVQYRVDLPNDDETKRALVGLYRGLRVRMSTAEVAFDPTVKNASRIFRLYGTTNQKAGRRSSCEFPSTPVTLSADCVLSTAEALTPPKPQIAPAKRKRVKSKGLHNFDVVALFQRLGLYKRELGDGKHAVICPQVHLHSSDDHFNKTDTVIWEGEWPQFHCSHAHCDGVNIYDVLDRYA